MITTGVWKIPCYKEGQPCCFTTKIAELIYSKYSDFCGKTLPIAQYSPISYNYSYLLHLLLHLLLKYYHFLILMIIKQHNFYNNHAKDVRMPRNYKKRGERISGQMISWSWPWKL